MNRSMVVSFLVASITVAGLSNAGMLSSAAAPMPDEFVTSVNASAGAPQVLPGKSKKHKKKMSKQMKKKKRH